ncbi:hypothetical protein CA235_10080 [Sphingomonas sp. ABOLF]|uniref:hypothetical protein n=1 Tax=Sphingomonas sp. ABOLF TaxID=1985879 RepID=UPI000F7F41F8|nr:hypothetical protein [Sphingomonas sp. ABOLF]RSV14865.1 hypothetical protein CA235_10080 [Sphingomonas sp. ABOLF]
MATTRTRTDEAAPTRSKAGADGIYWGIRLVKPAVPPRTRVASLRKAVETAFDKNADAIGRIK